MFTAAHAHAHTPLYLSKENNITTLKGLACFIWLKWVNKRAFSTYSFPVPWYIQFIQGLYIISHFYHISARLCSVQIVCSLQEICISVQCFEVLLNKEVIHMVIFSQWTSNLSTCLTAHSVQMAATCKSPQLEDKEDFLVFEGPSFVWIWPSFSIAAAYV